MMSNPILNGSVYTYSRVSEDDKKTGSCSLQWQQDTMRTWCDEHGLAITQEFSDPNTSASIPLPKRKSGKQLMVRAVNDGEIVLVAKMDRIFRSVPDFRSCLAAWQSLGVAFVSATETHDLDSPNGLMTATIVVAVSEYELSQIGGRIRSALHSRREHGLRASTEPKYGWRHVPFGPIRRDGSQEAHVVVNMDEQLIILRIRDLRAQFFSLRAIADHLNAARVPTRRGGPWSFSTVAGILKEFRENLHPQTPDDEPPMVVHE